MRAKGDGGHRENKGINQHEQILQRPRQRAQGMHGSAPGLVCMHSGFQISCFYGILQWVSLSWKENKTRFQHKWHLFFQYMQLGGNSNLFS